MSRTVSLSRLAKSAGLEPYEVALALIDRGVEVDDPGRELDATTRRVARAVIREMLGGPKVVRPKTSPELPTIAPAPRSSALLGTLSVHDVLAIHEQLCADFAASQDPIDPPGVRSDDLLESAVSRQESGYGGVLKYHEPVLNAATLLYGICNDHPFYNGNKRTALVAALAHLDRNRLLLGTTRQRDLFNLMISVADHSVVQTRVKVGRETKHIPRRGSPDEEVAAIADWLTPRVERVTRGEISITYRELRQTLSKFGFSLQNLKNQKVAVCVTETRRGLIRRGPHRKTVMSIEWPGDGKTVSIGQMKHLRSTLRLREEDGVTREAFYETGIRVDRFINDYRQVLRKLASR